MSCSGSAGEGPTGLAALEIWEQAQALVLGGADMAPASDQTSRQSADHRFWMDSSPAGPIQPGQSLPWQGASGMVPTSRPVPLACSGGRRVAWTKP